jgi:hypothetical protein
MNLTRHDRICDLVGGTWSASDLDENALHHTAPVAQAG